MSFTPHPIKGKPHPSGPFGASAVNQMEAQAKASNILPSKDIMVQKTPAGTMLTLRDKTKSSETVNVDAHVSYAPVICNYPFLAYQGSTFVSSTAGGSNGVSYAAGTTFHAQNHFLQTSGYGYIIFPISRFMHAEMLAGGMTQAEFDSKTVQIRWLNQDGVDPITYAWQLNAGISEHADYTAPITVPRPSFIRKGQSGYFDPVFECDSDQGTQLVQSGLWYVHEKVVMCNFLYNPNVGGLVDTRPKIDMVPLIALGEPTLTADPLDTFQRVAAIADMSHFDPKMGWKYNP